MKKLTATAASAAILLTACGSQDMAKRMPAIPVDAEIEAKVEKTLSTMTLDQKVGQMLELQIDGLGGWGEDGKFHLDPVKVDTVLVKYHVGSVLNCPGHALSPEDWNAVIGEVQKVSVEKIGIPTLYGIDQNHGASYSIGATYFPQNLNVGATFNPEIAFRAGEITAYETRACGGPWTYCPTLDLARDPRWPRFWENYGEDAYVNAVMGVASTRGMQGDDPNHVDRNHIAVSIKHYLGYGMPFSGKDRTPAYISPADLKEKHLAPFKAAILQGGALTLMANSGSVNGTPVHASHELLTEWVKEGLNWDGMIVTDWSDINNLWQREKVAKDKKDAICMAVNAGIDMCMEPYNADFCVYLKELVQEGRVPQSRVDDAVRRILRVKYRLGLFDEPVTGVKDYPRYGCREFAAVALQGAEESEVLLKNENALLPLKPGTKILVTGPNANSMRTLNGGWSYTWQGDADRYAQEFNTVYEALQQKFGAANVTFAPGVSYKTDGAWWEEDEPNIGQAVEAASRADVIVACVGENSYCETPGNLDDLNLSGNQKELVKALSKTGKPIVLILNEGRPRLVNDIEPLAQAVVDVMLPGNYGGDALANLLAGDANFSGKLPFTYPRYINGLSTYDYKVSERSATMEGAYDYSADVKVQWPFGFGLSYTTFKYSNLKVDKTQFTAGDSLAFTVDVTNSGRVAGKEAVMLFTSDLVASLVPDNRRLRAFDKIALTPGETKTVTLKIAAKDLSFVNAKGEWTLEPGDFKAQIGTEVVRLTLK